MIEARWGLARYLAMQRHWREHGPPVHIAIAAWLGLSRPRRPMVGPDDLAELLGSFSNGTRA